MIDAKVLERHGIKPDEYERIVAFLGREPNLTELGIFSVMWSEHCSYKSSRVYLRTLPTEGPQVIQGPGENAGAVDIGDGLAAVFKIESHNHPSFIEPYQGAATGVGGIIRDIFTMGARPIALLNSLRFGALDQPATKRLLEGVVAGIAGYGNSIGIPTVGGEIGFDPCYAGNPLVNVFCLGIARASDIIKGVASGVGNPVYYVGAKTGRDGIHGATMASAEFDDKSAEKRPAVQVGDPFMEKLLLEACLEVMQTDTLVGIQDMGAAGLTCSTTEMGSRGGAGIDIDVSLVPQRETGMTPYEIMLSESQERMLLVVKKGREAEVERIFEKWDLHAVCIGTVTDDGMLRIKERGDSRRRNSEPRADRRGARLSPSDRRFPTTWRDVQALDLEALSAGDGRQAAADANDALYRLLASPTIASKQWVYRQYDHMVQTNTVNLPGLGAGVLRIKGTDRAPGDVGRLQQPLLLPGSVPWARCWPSRRPAGTWRVRALARSPRPIASISATPSVRRSCGSSPGPSKGCRRACRALSVPITGGNVSLYNETDGRAIYPDARHRRRRTSRPRRSRARSTIPWRRATRSCCSVAVSTSSAAVSI